MVEYHSIFDGDKEVAHTFIIGMKRISALIFSGDKNTVDKLSIQNKLNKKLMKLCTDGDIIEAQVLLNNG